MPWFRASYFVHHTVGMWLVGPTDASGSAYVYVHGSMVLINQTDGSYTFSSNSHLDSIVALGGRRELVGCEYKVNLFLMVVGPISLRCGARQQPTLYRSSGRSKHPPPDLLPSDSMHSPSNALKGTIACFNRIPTPSDCFAYRTAEESN